MQARDLYVVIGVPFNASSQDIRAAYLRKSLETHPDKGGDEVLFRDVREAYDVLSDESKRRAYDRSHGFTPTPFSFSSSPSFSFSPSSFASSSSDPRSFGARSRPPSDDPRQRPPKRSSFSSASFGEASSFGGRASGGSEERWKKVRKTSPCREESVKEGEAKEKVVIEEDPDSVFHFSWA